MTKAPSPPSARSAFAAACALLLCLLTAPAPARAQDGLGPFERDSARDMLKAMKEDLKKNYYDPNLRGIDIEARYKEAEEKLKQAQTRDQLMVAVAQFMLDLNDSHTFFLPPFRAARVRYGFRLQMIGDACVAADVNPASDAAKKGLKPGDVVLAVDGRRPARDNLWKMHYRYYVLMPARSIRLTVQSPGEAQPRELEALSRVQQMAAVSPYASHVFRYDSEMRLPDDRFHELGDAVVWRMPGFEIDPERVDELMGRVRKFKTLILDLRGNGGGYVVTLGRLVGHFFDHDVKLADLKERKETKPQVGKTRGGDKVFKGRLVVLVDSETASAAEMFASVVQSEKRGTVIGDRTKGAVMTSRSFEHQTGAGTVLRYGSSVTVADVILPDGRSLERTGVTPDEVLLPTPADVAARRDPVLARAASLAGVELDPVKAGSLFPSEWLK